MLDGSSELTYENGEEPLRGILHVRNQATVIYNTIYVFEELYVDTLCMLWVYPCLYFVFKRNKNN